MARRRDKLKADVRKYFDFKNIKSWEGYNNTLPLERNWDDAIEEYRRKEERRELSARRIQEAWRENSVLQMREFVTATSRFGDFFRDYLFDLTETEEAGMLREVRRALRFVPKSETTALYSIVAFGGNSWRVFSTPHYTTKQQAYEVFEQRLAEHLIKYEMNAVVHDISIKVIEPNKRNGSGGRSYIQASKVWKIISPRAERNCAYKSVVLCLAKKDHEKLLEQPALLTRRASDLKYRVNPEHKAYANDEDLQLIANYKKVPIILYNNVYEKVKVFEPSGEINKRSDRMLKKDALEIKLEANHYYAMLRRTDIGEPYAPEVKPTSVDGAHELIKTRNILKLYDDKFVAWDLECTGNGTDGGIHKCYASGFAWGDKYRSFWGLKAIQQSLDFIYDNREAFHGHTFYAHNGGSYDMTFMFREGLLEDKRFKVENCVEQESSYIHVKVFVGDCVIVFHDSLKLLPRGLSELCKDIKVKHQKLTETVNHDDITVDNWMDFPQLPKYLENDCKGLYEVLEAFSKQAFSATAQYEFRGCEAYTRQIFEHAFDVELKKTRPKWLNGLELDGYNPELHVAFEYDGEQHAVFPNWFHKTEEEFIQLQENDRKKDALCLENNVKLYRIPHWVKFKDLPSFISKLIDKDIQLKHGCKHIHFNRGRQVGINMTACYTGASLSKKSFMAKYYKPQKYPIYSLNQSADKFIRDYYRGGRVEIFHLGRVPGDKFYYYDFTSLYPAMGTKDLPYGEPVWVDKFDVFEHFGFASVLVKSREHMIHKKPLHGLLEDGKFLFRHFKEWTPLTVFSEELKHGIKSGMYEYDIQGGLTFQSAPWMADFFTDAFKRKADAKRDGNPALAQVWKIMANSGYGFWGIRVKDRDCILIQDADKSVIYPYLENGKFLNYSEIGDHSIMRVEADLPVTDFNVGVASAISSYSRCRLWSLIDAIESKGKKVFMCDTDSVITDLNISEYPDLMSEYMWDGCGDDLGSLKNEADDFLKDEGHTKDEIKLLKEESLGMIPFDDLILGGCKFYTLRKKGCKNIIAKCKGYKKGKDGSDLTFEDFEWMAGDKVSVYINYNDDGSINKIDTLVGTHAQRQVQFVCPKMNHVSMDEKFAMRTPHITKKFKFCYKKGIVADDGSITPFYY
jgi:hypothetical protein